MNIPNSPFEIVFKNSLGDDVAGIWFMDGTWKISTDPLSQFSTKAEALDAWESRFNHHSGLPLPCPRKTVSHKMSKESR